MEEQPILEPGIHDFELSEIGNHFLKDFVGSETRAPLIANLQTYVKYLSGLGASIELWIDGSFTTNKLNPNDIDLVVFSPETELDALPPEKQKMFQALTDRASVKQHFGLDVLFCVAEDHDMRSYWRGWYGFDRNERPKGIARVMVVA
ncbi:DUF6932 family protein [Aliidiomarina haloalkalitolerans]|uniref:Polymerase nucleotidyl transferase domain-containing protein n=1 Tax=Aliidiomarina haloalkalitolerans TaxID=859059 RepID=A0A432VRI8_9GAMM|nr:hypothetical protein [Aliidiomarina haloalkalitolerans]RUO18932.1 hypothetical protein CWE06_10080 [Aliidiomarina haloalkalitolerans]